GRVTSAGPAAPRHETRRPAKRGRSRSARFAGGTERATRWRLPRNEWTGRTYGLRHGVVDLNSERQLLPWRFAAYCSHVKQVAKTPARLATARPSGSRFSGRRGKGTRHG